MTLYKSNVTDFIGDVNDKLIADKLRDSFVCAFGKRPAPNEVQSWNNSLRFMESIVRKSEIAGDCRVLIECTLPLCSKRVDIMITGCNETGQKACVIIELKQWQKAEATERDHIVRTFVDGKERGVTHPSYQALSYKQILDNMNTAIETNAIKSYACSYLHNYDTSKPEPLTDSRYREIIDNAPVFFKHDAEKLQEYLYERVGKGRGMEIIRLIEHGEIKPSKKLMDCVASLFNGRQEYVLLEEQRIAYSDIIKIAEKMDRRRTVIVKGGPGTGKSVVALNVICEFNKRKLNMKFVAPNNAFKNVLLENLTGSVACTAKSLVDDSLFSGSFRFYNAKPNTYDVLVVDEAHRLKGPKANSEKFKVNNQVEDIIRTSKINVFFIDDSQRVRPEDIGSVNEIRRFAKMYDSMVYEIELETQFRCAGAKGFISRLDTVLQIRDTGSNETWDRDLYEFKIFENPNDLRKELKSKSESGFYSRLLAGYAWEWKKGNENGEIDDIEIPEHNFYMPWNSRSNGFLWAVNPSGENQIGCIHTSQGLEFDYAGVIIGRDLKYNTVTKRVEADFKHYKDTCSREARAELSNSPAELTKLVCNVYKVLLTRGMKGCYIYCVDEGLQQYFKEQFAYTENAANKASGTKK